MITENLSTLKIHKLTQEQYDREVAAGTIDPTAIYLTPESSGGNVDTEALKNELKDYCDELILGGSW